MNLRREAMAKSPGMQRTGVGGRDLVQVAAIIGVLAFVFSKLGHWKLAYLLGSCSVVCLIYVSVRWLRSFKVDTHLCFVVLENRLSNDVFVEWGRARDLSFQYSSERGLLAADHAVSRYLAINQPRATVMDRPCVRVSQSADGKAKNRSVTIILWEFDERCHTKVYQITDKGILERRNPTQRNWHTGDLEALPSKDDLFSRIGYLAQCTQ